MRHFIILCALASCLMSPMAYADNNNPTQNVMVSGQHAKINSISLEEGIIVLNQKTYTITPKVQVSNDKNLPLDPGSLAADQKVEFWSDNSFNPQNNLQGGNIIKIRILSHISEEAIYH